MDTYGLIIKREKQENYGFPMSLKNIDELTTNNSLEQLLNIVKESNMIPNLDEVNPSFAIAKKRNNKWVIDKQTPIITDPFILTYPLEDILLHNDKNYCNILYSHLSALLTKPYISEQMKDAITALKTSASEFINIYNTLDYSEKRKIKTVFANCVDVHSLIEPLEVLQLQRKKEDN